jgi:hypothetical protein
VLIYYDIGVDEGLTSTVFNERGPQILAVIPLHPVRIAAMHLCTDNLVAKTAFSMAQYYIEAEFVLRFTSQFGSPSECQYSLMTFGIPLSTLPVRQDGKLDLKLHHDWLGRLEADERLGNVSSSVSSSSHHLGPRISSFEDSSQVITQPGSCDIILGRGLRGRKYGGNQLLKRLLEEHRFEYDSASRSNKPNIVKDLYLLLRQKGCRFLSPSADSNNNDTTNNCKGATTTSKSGGGVEANFVGEWLEVAEREALDRIGHGFRNLRTTTKK